MNTEPTTPEEQESLEAHLALLELQSLGEQSSSTAIITDTPVPETYSSICKIEPAHRLEESLKLKFHELVKTSDKAICLAFCDLDTGAVIDEWFPKGVCANLNLSEGTVYVWEKFLRDAKPYFLRETEHHAD